MIFQLNKLRYANSMSKFTKTWRYLEPLVKKFIEKTDDCQSIDKNFNDSNCNQFRANILNSDMKHSLSTCVIVYILSFISLKKWLFWKRNCLTKGKYYFTVDVFYLLRMATVNRHFDLWSTLTRSTWLLLL